MLLIISGIALFLSLTLFNGATVLGQVNPFQSADLYKISLFSMGISPYSTEPWAAPYPPFYFILSSPLYILLTDYLRLSSSDVFTSFRIVSTLLTCVCGFLIYETVKVEGGSAEKARSLASIFMLCGLTALIYPVGDLPGLAMLSGGCLLLALRKTWLGVLLVSFAVAFKIHPILGAVLVLVSLYSLDLARKRNAQRINEIAVTQNQVRSSPSDFSKSLVALASVIISLMIIPILIIQDSWSSFVLFNAQNIQHYTFNVYAALLDIGYNFAPSSVNSFTIAVDTAWLAASAALALLLARLFLNERSSLRRNQGLTGFELVDVLSLGILAWLLILKQTMPNYFLWALIPLLASGRTRSAVLVLAGEFLGMVFFGLAQAFATGLFSGQTPFVAYPSLEVSILLLVGGILFDFFIAFAMLELVYGMKLDKTRDLGKHACVMSGLTSPT